MNESPGRFFHFSMEYCKILLLNFTGSELLAQAPCRLGCAAVKDHSGYRAIQTVNQGQKYLAGFLISFFEPVFGELEKRNSPV
jgi:hypothetical protein